MGSSTVHYRDRKFEANDTALEVWLQLLIREIDRLDAPEPWLREVREEWDLQSTAGFGFGVVPDLDRFATGEGRRASLLSLCEAARRRLDGLGETVSPREVRALEVEGPGAEFTKVLPTAFFRDVGQQFIDLLRGYPEAS